VAIQAGRRRDLICQFRARRRWLPEARQAWCAADRPSFPGPLPLQLSTKPSEAKTPENLAFGSSWVVGGSFSGLAWPAVAAAPRPARASRLRAFAAFVRCGSVKAGSPGRRLPPRPGAVVCSRPNPPVAWTLLDNFKAWLDQKLAARAVPLAGGRLSPYASTLRRADDPLARDDR